MQSNQIYNVIGKECHKDWEVIEVMGKLRFSHPKYKNKTFEIAVIQDIEKKGEIKKNLYPISEPDNDPENLCFNTTLKGELIPNKFPDFWNTRKGKKLAQYTNYRKDREQTKKEYQLIKMKKN